MTTPNPAPETGTLPNPRYFPKEDLQAIFKWFDHWLESPLTERERVIVGEAINCVRWKHHERYL